MNFLRQHSSAARPARRIGLLLPPALAMCLALLGAGPAWAATPASGTLSLGNPSLSWTSTIFGAGSGENTCQNGTTCDTFTITVAPGDYTHKQMNVTLTWTVAAYDYDLYVH